MGDVQLQFGRVGDDRGVLSADGRVLAADVRFDAAPASARRRLLPALRQPAGDRAAVGDHAAGRWRDRRADHALRGMRRRLTAAAAGLLLVVLVVVGVRAVLGRGDGDSGDSSAPPAGCTRIARPPTPLLTELRQRAQRGPRRLPRAHLPERGGAARLERRARRSCTSADPGRARRGRRACCSTASRPADGCPAPALDPAEVRRDHPEWILRDASGADVHPPDHPNWVHVRHRQRRLPGGLGERRRRPSCPNGRLDGGGAGRRRKPPGAGCSRRSTPSPASR